MRVVNDEGDARTTDEATVACEPAPDGEPADHERSDPTMDRDQWTPEEEGYGYGV